MLLMSVIGERSETLSDKLGGEICIATRALVCIYLSIIYTLDISGVVEVDSPAVHCASSEVLGYAADVDGPAPFRVQISLQTHLNVPQNCLVNNFSYYAENCQCVSRAI